MNSRERVIESLNCRVPDKIPKALGFFSQPIEGIVSALPEADFSLDVRFLEFNPPEQQDAFLEYIQGLPQGLHIGNLAQLNVYHEWEYHPERGNSRPLDHIRSLEELNAYRFPHLTDPRRWQGLAARVASWHAQGYAVAGSPPHLGGELFEMAIRLRSFERFMEDLVDRKHLAHHLLDQLTEMLIENVIILSGTGIDILLLDDDIAMPTGLMIAPATWREFLKPRLARAIAVAKEASPDLIVFYHSDGDFTRVVPELVEIGVDVVNPVQPDCMNAAAIKTQFGDRLALWGTVGTAPLWDGGTPGQIREAVRQSIQRLGPGGLLLAPAYDIDFTPLENIVAFVEAAEEFGRL